MRPLAVNVILHAMEGDDRTVLRAIRASDLGWLVAEGEDTTTCVSCGRPVVETDFGGFVKTKEEPVVFCDRPECLEYVMGGGRG